LFCWGGTEAATRRATTVTTMTQRKTTTRSGSNDAKGNSSGAKRQREVAYWNEGNGVGENLALAFWFLDGLKTYFHFCNALLSSLPLPAHFFCFVG